MFRGAPWFAWYPVIVQQRRGTRWAWLEYVWRDITTFSDGSSKRRYYQH